MAEEISSPAENLRARAQMLRHRASSADSSANDFEVDVKNLREAAEALRAKSVEFEAAADRLEN